MKKEINGPVAIVLIVGVVVVVLGAGWYLMNREPQRVGTNSTNTTLPADSNTPGSGQLRSGPSKFVPPGR